MWGELQRAYLAVTVCETLDEAVKVATSLAGVDDNSNICIVQPSQRFYPFKNKPIHPRKNVANARLPTVPKLDPQYLLNALNDDRYRGKFTVCFTSRCHRCVICPSVMAFTDEGIPTRLTVRGLREAAVVVLWLQDLDWSPPFFE